MTIAFITLLYRAERKTGVKGDYYRWDILRTAWSLPVEDMRKIYSGLIRSVAKVSYEAEGEIVNAWNQAWPKGTFYIYTKVCTYNMYYYIYIGCSGKKDDDVNLQFSIPNVVDVSCDPVRILL